MGNLEKFEDPLYWRTLFRIFRNHPRWGRPPVRQNTMNMDVKAKLERSRQSARECRARKKLRYQYLEELVTEREKAVLLLRKELDKYRQWSKEIDEGKVPEGFEAFLETYLDGDSAKNEP